MKLVLLGPPGAGKGTEADLLKRHLGIEHISTGDMLRDQVRKETPLGVEAKKYMDSGELVPDEVVIGMVSEKVEESNSASFALDGFPRTRVQAESLDKLLKELNKPVDLVLYFDTSEPMIIKRLGGRRVCTECRVNYHLTNHPPKKEGICDRCGSQLIQRVDDAEESIKVRLKAYEEKTAELIDYYRETGTLREIPGDYDSKELFDYLKDLFKKEGFLSE